MRRLVKFGFIRMSFIFILLLMMLSWYYILFIEQASLLQLFSQENLHYAKKFLDGLLGVGNDNPAYTNPEHWFTALQLTLETLVMSIMAIGFATVGMLVTVIPAAQTTATGSLSRIQAGYRQMLYSIIRLIYVLSRAVPELIWAMMIIFVFKPGILPGALALAIHNFGILGKLCAEVMEDQDLRPLRSLASSGANKAQIFLYGVIPAVMPKFITYILYRWEVIIRTTIVVGFVGAGGLGREFRLSMSYFDYTMVGLFLICYVALVLIVDLISEGLRKWAK